MKSLLRVVACLSLCVSLNSLGALYDRGNGLIYDDALDITWLQDAKHLWHQFIIEGALTTHWYQQYSPLNSDGQMTWAAANLWVNNLDYGGFNNWRLPSIRDKQFSGYNIASSELGYMFYENLDNEAGQSILSNSGLVITSENGTVSSFTNVQDLPYWYSELVEADSQYAWAFHAGVGLQRTFSTSSMAAIAWPVHDGDIGLAPVPLPAGIYLFLSGLVGLGLMRGRNG